MKIINKDQVSHILIFNEKEGIKTYSGGFSKRVWMPTEYFKILWFIKTPLENYEEGFYKDRKREWIINDEPFELDKERHFIKDNNIWSFPHIEVYSGKDLIHREYFTKFATLEQHVNYNYPNCKIKYE